MGDSQSRVARLGLAGGRAPAVGPPTGWPACLRRAGLLALALSAGADRRQVDEFLYRLYGMYLAVLAARCAHTRSGEQGQGEALFPRRPAPGGKGGYPWQDFSGPVPQLPAVPAMRLPRQGGRGSRRSPRTWSARQRPSDGRTAQGMSTR